LHANKEFAQRVVRAYGSRQFSHTKDVDLALYDGFLNDADRRKLVRIRDSSPQDLARDNFGFEDARLPDLLFRYRARNWPETLSEEEARRWEQFRTHRLQDADGGGSITMHDYYQRIAMLRDARVDDAEALKILDAMEAWGRDLSC
jgi:exodeoxyribonuclease-1